MAEPAARRGAATSTTVDTPPTTRDEDAHRDGVECADAAMPLAVEAEPCSAHSDDQQPALDCLDDGANIASEQANAPQREQGHEQREQIYTEGEDIQETTTEAQAVALQLAAQAQAEAQAQWQRHLARQQDQERANVMQHIQQRLQERIQLKQQQHQQMGSDALQGGVAVMDAAGETTLGLHERIRREALQRLQDMQRQLQLHHQQQQQQQQQQQPQHQQTQTQTQNPSSALHVTLHGVPPRDASALPLAVHVEQERLKHLQLLQQQYYNAQQAAMAAATAATAAAAATTSGPTKKQSSQPKKKAVVSDKEGKKAGSRGDSAVTLALIKQGQVESKQVDGGGGATKANKSEKKKKKPTKKPCPPPERSQMEALVRVLCRMSVANEKKELQLCLTQLVTWLNRCVDPCLLQFAYRDFQKTMGAKSELIKASNTATMGVQAKCAYIDEKLQQLVRTYSQNESQQEQQQQASVEQDLTVASGEDKDGEAKPVPESTTPSVSQSSATALSKVDSAAIQREAREHAYAALMDQYMAAYRQRAHIQAVANTTRAGDLPVPSTPPESTDSNGYARPQKRPLLSAGPSKSEISNKKPRSDGVLSQANMGAPSIAPTAKGHSSLSQADGHGGRTVISATVMEHLFDLDTGARRCVLGPEEDDDRLYFPTRSISNVMRRVLPGGYTGSRYRRRGRSRRDLRAEKSDAKDTARKTAGTEVATSKRSRGGKKGDDDVEMEGGGMDDDDGDDDDGDGDGGGDGGDDGEEDDGASDGEGDANSGVPDGDGINTTGLSTTLRGPISKSLLARRFIADGDIEPVKIDEGALTLMQECVTEFLLFFTSEARDQSMMEKKKASITGSHVVRGLENLGFTAHAKVLGCYNDKIRKVQDEQTQKKLEKKQWAKEQQRLELLQQREQERQEREREHANMKSEDKSPPEEQAQQEDAFTAVPGGSGVAVNDDHSSHGIRPVSETPTTPATMATTAVAAVTATTTSTTVSLEKNDATTAAQSTLPTATVVSDAP